MALKEEEDTTKIIAGSNAKPGEIPYILNLRVRGEFHCGAVLVEVAGIEIALTAAHCIWLGYPDPLSAQPVKDIELVAGELKLSDHTGHEQTRKPTKIIIHEDYNRGDYPYNDIAIMFLDGAFNTKSRYVTPLILPRNKWDHPCNNFPF